MSIYSCYHVNCIWIKLRMKLLRYSNKYGKKSWKFHNKAYEYEINGALFWPRQACYVSITFSLWDWRHKTGGSDPDSNFTVGYPAVKRITSQGLTWKLRLFQLPTWTLFHSFLVFLTAIKKSFLELFANLMKVM